jgi:hypothetical protein
MADIETVAKRIISDAKKARSDKTLAFAITVYQKIELKLNE